MRIEIIYSNASRSIPKFQTRGEKNSPQAKKQLAISSKYSSKHQDFKSRVTPLYLTPPISNDTSDACSYDTIRVRVLEICEIFRSLLGMHTTSYGMALEFNVMWGALFLKQVYHQISDIWCSKSSIVREVCVLNCKSRSCLTSPLSHLFWVGVRCTHLTGINYGALYYLRFLYIFGT